MFAVDPYALAGRVPLVSDDDSGIVVVATAELRRIVTTEKDDSAIIPVPSVEYPDVVAVARSSKDEFQP